MFHTPNLFGLRKRLIPRRINEGWGLQHMKLYGVDDELIMSGYVQETLYSKIQTTDFRVKERISRTTILRIGKTVTTSSHPPRSPTTSFASTQLSAASATSSLPQVLPPAATP